MQDSALYTSQCKPPVIQVELSQDSLESEWTCYLFGLGPTGITVIPQSGKEPNWFWRKMQYLILGNEWVKRK